VRPARFDWLLHICIAARRVAAVLLLYVLGAAAFGALKPAQAQSLSIDVQVSKDSSSPSSNATTPAFSTTSTNELLLAFVSSDAANSTPNTSVTGIAGGGLTWQLVQRTNVQLGTAEIWRAFAKTKLTNATVTVTLSESVASSISVVTFIGADPSGLYGSGAIGAAGSGNGRTGAPTASLVTTRNNSWVFGVGNDWDHATARVVGSNQSLVHQYLATVNDTYWAQKLNVPTAQTGTTVTLNDTAPSTDRFNLSIVEVLPAQAPAYAGPLNIDVQVSSDKTPSTSNTAPAFSTTAANELLLAFVSSDSTATPNTTVTGITGAGLTWQLVKRTNVQSGTAEVWRAFAPNILTNASITVSLSQKVANSVTVLSFIGADPSGTNGSGAIGAVGTGNAHPGAPTATLVSTRNYSWVFGVGNDWDNAISRTAGQNQSVVHQYLATVNDTYWVQAENLPTPQSGTTVTVNDMAPTTDRYNLSTVEVLPQFGTPPQITAGVSPAANANAWNNTPVTVTFTCQAGSAPIIQCPNPVIVSSQGANQQISGTVTDLAGLTATVVVNVGIDLTAPSLSITSPANGATFTSSAVTVTGNVSDALSGISTVTCNGAAASVQSGTFSCSLTLAVGANAIAVQATDRAGNASTQSLSVTFASGLTVSSFSPASGSEGTLVTVTGSNFTVNNATPQVTLSAQGGGTIAAPISSASVASLTFVIPSGAATGVITVTTNSQSATSATSLTVVASSSFTLSALPSSATLLPGQTTTYQVSLASANGFTQLAALSIQGLPSGVTASFQPPQITAGGSSILTVSAPAAQASGSSQLTIAANATVQGIAQNSSATVGLNVQVAGNVAFAGRAAVTGDPYDTPLVGLTVTFTGLDYTGNSTGCTASTTTDSSGNFTFASLPNACGGPQLVRYDPSTVSSPPGSYSGVALSYVLTPGQVTTPGIVVHLPRVDNAETVMVTQNASDDQTFTFKSIANLTITVYAGTTLSLADGTQPSPFPLSVVEIPYEDLPEKMQPDPTQDPVFAMSIEPFNSSSSQPVSVNYPNRSNMPPGTNMPLTSLNPVLGMMVNYGTGTVTGDGTQVLPDFDPANQGHRYGISHFDWHFFLPTAQNQTNPSPDPKTPPTGDPVDPASGLLVVTKTDMAFGGARGQLAITRTFRGISVNPGPFGIGTNHNYGIMLDTTNEASGQLTLIMPDGNQYPFVAQGDGTFVNSKIPSVRGAVVSNLTCASTQIGFGCGATLTWKNGTTYKFQAPWEGPQPGVAFLMSMTDPNGNTTTLVRMLGAPIEITQITDPVGRSLNLTYDDSRRIASIADPIGRTVQYTYNSQGTLATVVDANGGATSYTYDAENRMTSITDPRGITYLQNFYDPSGHVLKQVAADGGVTTFSYTQLNPVVSTSVGVSPAGSAGVGGAAIVGSGSIQGVNTSPIVRTTVTDPLGNTTSYHFNPSGFLLDVTDALGEKTIYTVDANTNQTVSTTDPLGRTTAFTYDSNGSATSITKLAGTQNPVTTSFIYDPTFNKITSGTDPLGNTTTFKYDTAGNLLSITDPLNEKTTFAYDNLGELIIATDSLGNATQFVYANGDLVQTTDALGRASTRATDLVSRQVSVTNPLGQSDQLQYNGLNQITQSTDSLGNQTGFTFDGNGNLLTLTDANQHTTSYTYDSMDRVATRADPLGHSEVYQHDQDGNLTQFNDRRGVATTRSYDLLNRPTQVTFGGQSSITYSYDSVSRLTQATDSNTGPIVRAYDGLDRLISEVTPQGNVDYAYDLAGRRTKMSVSGQSPVGYSYDNASRLTQIAQGTSAVSFAYDADGRRTSLTLPNGVVESFAYDNASQLLTINYQLGSSTLGNLTYSYELAGRRTVGGGSFARSNVPAALPNASNNADNQVTQFGPSSFTYDANGNMMSDGSNTYTWDARNQLVSISGHVAASFQYDSFGRRVSKTIGGTTQFLYDGINPVQEISGGTPSANLLTGLVADEYFQRTDISGAANFLTDALGSTLALTNSSGSILAQYTYDPFGNTTVTSGSSTNSYEYTGRENDGTGLIFYRARYYSTAIQRFISEDPVGTVGGINLYAYVGNDVPNQSDPSGLWSPGAHDVLIQHALAGNATLSDIAALQADSRAFDSSTQGIAWANAHAMAMPGQSSADAIAATHAFESQMIAAAQAAAAAGDRQSALQYLAQAMHPMMDSSSPAHTDDNGNPITYSDPSLLADWWNGHSGPDMPIIGGKETIYGLTPPILHKEDQMLLDAYNSVFGPSAAQASTAGRK
jgi:RHS repeat-associated protein